MKCIKSIKQSKKVELGTVRRVGEKEAESEVKSGYWQYVPKNEWKQNKVTQPVEETKTETEQPTKTKKNAKKTFK